MPLLFESGRMDSMPKKIDPKVKDWTFEVVDGGDKADVDATTRFR